MENGLMKGGFPFRRNSRAIDFSQKTDFVSPNLFFTPDTNWKKRRISSYRLTEKKTTVHFGRLEPLVW